MARLVWEFWPLLLPLAFAGIWWHFFARLKYTPRTHKRIGFAILLGFLGVVLIGTLIIGFLNRADKNDHYIPAQLENGMLVPGKKVQK